MAQKAHTSPRTLKVGSGSTITAKQGKGSARANKAILGAIRCPLGAKAEQARREFCRYLAFCEETGADRPPCKGITPLWVTLKESCRNCYTPKRPGHTLCNRCLLIKRYANKGIPLITRHANSQWSAPNV